MFAFSVSIEALLLFQISRALRKSRLDAVRLRGFGAGRRRGLLDDVEIFLRDEIPVRKQAELIPARCREDQRRNIHAEIMNLQPVFDFNRPQRGCPDELILIQIHETKLKLILSFRVRQTKIDSHLGVLAGKACRPQMRKRSDDALLSGKAVQDHRIANQKGLHDGFDKFVHGVGPYQQNYSSVIPDVSHRESSVFHFTDEERSKDPGSSIKDVEDDRRRMGLSDDATPVLSEVEGSSDLLCHQTYSWRKSSRLSVNDVLEIT